MSQVRNAISTRLTMKLTLILVLVAVIPMVIIAVISLTKASSALTDLGLNAAHQQNATNNGELTTFISQFSTDLMMFSDTPPVQGVIRARDNNGIDPKSNDAQGVWANRLTQIFAAAARNKGFYQQLRYLDEDGNEMVRVDYKNGQANLKTGTDSLANKGTSSYFTGTRDMQKGEVFISALNLNKEGGKVEVPHVPVLRFSTPVIDPSGTFRGAIVSNVYASSFLGRLTSETGDIYLATEDGSFAIHPDASNTFGTDVGTGVQFDDFFGDAHNALKTSDEATYIGQHDGDVVSLQPVLFDAADPDRHWLIVETLPTSDVLAPVTSLRNIVIGVALALGIAAAVFAMWLARGITRPLIGVGKILETLSTETVGRLTATTNAVANGDLTARANISVVKADVTSRDEIGLMSEAANRLGDGIVGVGDSVDSMVEGLTDLIGQVNTTAGDLAGASGELASAAEQAGEGTTGIATAAQEVSNGSVEQMDGVEKTSAEVTGLSTLITSIAEASSQQAESIGQASDIVGQVSRATAEMAENAQSATEGARTANSAASEGLDTVRQTVAGMDSITSAVEQAAKQIEALGEQSAEIGNIVSVIDDIAAQTNLLALNAAIEAARAGEQGRGFAVVADEVRSLAERVTDATKEISDLIQGVQDGVQSSVRAAEQAGQEVETGAAMAAKSGEALEEIDRAVGGVSAQIEQISAAAEEVSASADEMVNTIDIVREVTERNTAATEQMTVSSDDVQTSVTSIASVTQQASAAAQEMSASSEEVGAQVEQVVASSQSLTDMADGLKTLVQRFKLSSSNGGGTASNSAS